MIQDILPHSLNISYLHKPIVESGIVFCFDDGKVLTANHADGEAGTVVETAYASRDGSECKCAIVSEPHSAIDHSIESVFPRCFELEFVKQQAVYLFSIDDDDFFLVEPEHIKMPEACTFTDASLFRTMQPRHLAFAGVTAQHLNNWYAVNKFCGRCGNVLVHDQVERMMFCEKCRNAIYPKIAPAVIVGIYRGDELLMTKYANRPQSRFALIAGFVEIGETAEDTVRREVAEEVGLKVKNLRYYKSQPWGLSGSFLMGFYAELDGDSTVTLDTNELSEAIWMHRNDIDITFDDFSLTNEMICRFKQGL